MDVLVGPVHFRDVYQSFNTFFDFSKAAIIGEIGNRRHHAGALWITSYDVSPRIITQLLHTEADAVFLAVEFQNSYVDFVTNINHFAWMTNALPSHIGNVQQPVYPAQINKGTVIGQVLNDTLNVLAFLHGRQQFFALMAIFFFQYRSSRYHDVVTLLVKLDHFEFKRLAFQVRCFAQRANIHQGARKKGSNVVDVNGEPTLNLAIDDTNDYFALFAGFFQLFPAFRTACFFPGQTCFTEAVVHYFHRNLHLVPDGQRANALFVEKLIFWDNPFGLQSGVNDNPVIVNIYHRAGYDGPWRHLDGV